MDPISFAPLALSAWNLIVPYAKRLGAKLVEKAGESLPDVVDKLWDAVKEKMESRAETKELPADLVAAPEDQAVQDAFQYQLKKLLENDEAFAYQLEILVNQAQQAAANMNTMEGDGAMAQGDHSVAAGKGGIYVGGNVSGSNLITGNQNIVNDHIKKRK